MTLHAFIVVDNSIAFKFFVGDKNTVQKFEGELSQPVIFSCFVYYCPRGVYKTRGGRIELPA